MKRASLLLAAFAVSLALGGVGSTPAFAKCPAGEPDNVTEEWCIKGVAIGGPFTIEPKTAPEKNFVWAAAGIIVECTSLELDKGKLEAPKSGMVEHLIFAGCAVTTGNPPCALVGKEIDTVTVVMERVKEVGANEVEITIKQKEGAQLGEMTFNGVECALAGAKQPVTGTFEIRIPTGQKELEKQPLEIGATTLKLGKNALTLTGKAAATLAVKEKWSFD